MSAENPGGRERRRLHRALEWSALLVLTALSLVLGYLGFRQYFAATGEIRSSLDILYLTLQLFTMESGAVEGTVPLLLEIARYLAPAVAVYAAGKALATLFRRQLQRLRLRFVKDHAVICGGGRKGLLLTRAFVRSGDRVVVIEKDKEADTISSLEEAGATVLFGDATERACLVQAGVPRAAYLISVSGDDGTDAEVAVRARQLAQSRTGEPLVCAAHLLDPELFRLLRQRWFSTQEDEFFRLEFFNLFERGARALLEHHPPFGEGQLSGERPHVLLVGVGRLGESLLVQVARRWWRQMGESGVRLPVSLIDRRADEKGNTLKSRYPGLAATCRLRLLEMEFPSASFEEAKILEGDGEVPPVSAIFVCFDNDSLSLTTALNLHDRLAGRDVPVVARMQEDAGLAKLLWGEGLAGSAFSNLDGFGLLDRTWTLESVLSGVAETLARALHENYLRSRIAEGDSVVTNPSLVAWSDLPESVRRSNRQQALAIRQELEVADCALEPQRDWRAPVFELSGTEVDLLARVEHDRWVAERRSQGWSKGLAKDPGRKEHPLLVPWDTLEDEKAKDRLRKDLSTLPLALADIGFTICRRRA